MLGSTIDHQDFEKGAQGELDNRLLVKFFLKERPDKAQTQEQGRPIFKEVEYVDIKVAGSRNGGACRPATIHDKQRFSRHYEAFKQRIELPLTGTPLGEWALMPRTLVDQLAFMHVKTVEQLSEMSDTDASKVMGLIGLKGKAVKWLESSDKTALINELDVLKASSDEKDAKIESLTNTLSTLEERLNALETADPVEETKAVRRKR